MPPPKGRPRLLAAVLAAALASAGAGANAGPAHSAPTERRDYWCDDGRRVLGAFGPDGASLNIDHLGIVALAVVQAPTGGRPAAYRSDTFAGGPVVAVRRGELLTLVSPGWPDTVCRP